MKKDRVLDKLRRAVQLSRTEWLLFIQAWIWLLLFDIGLRICPFPTLQAFAARPVFQPIPSPDQREKLLYRSTVAVDRARGHHLYLMTCLRRALTLQKMLVSRGIPAELKIGVRKDNRQLNAHAWLEYEGKPLGEPEEISERFSVLEKNTGSYP